MCGIVGYVGHQMAAPILLDGLARLEYRGYDSAGIAVLDYQGHVTVCKTPGKLTTLIESLNSHLPLGASGIGHTRWATHGRPNTVNAHPHLDCGKQVAVVHNGIVENYLELKEELKRSGHAFNSETDSEVIPHLIESLLAKEIPFEDAVREVAQLLRGAQAVVAMCAQEPGHLVAFRSGNAGGITVGYGEGEMFLASDLPAILPYTTRVAFLAPGEMVSVRREGARYHSFAGQEITKTPRRAPYSAVAIAKGGYRHFMLKEIMEQPDVIRRTLVGRISFDPPDVWLEDFPFNSAEIQDIHRVLLTGMGTSLHACQVGRLFIESLAGLPAESDNASELRYRDPILDRHTLVISVGQSGETADTLGAMETAAQLQARQITICNVEGSQATRMAHGTVGIGVGPEIGVASTKCLTGALVALCLLAAYLGKARGVLDSQRLGKVLQDLAAMPRLLSQVLDQGQHIEELAKKYFRYDHFLFLGRGINTPVAMEGALKLKEVSYIHAEGYAAGEMKHGPIALIDENMPVVVIAPRDHLYDKMCGNVEEVKARGGTVIALITQGDRELASKVDDTIEIPESPYLLSPIISVVPLQLLAYHIAVLRGCDVDQPRNLAKTVTVE
ncbi:MAG: glutamine--fructose-6-phosphate transaminase (isomerizing) [Dehalococcoidia bacterium]|nr:glutamine--fructose-6-phosphate transaminase (isomerizing) [Dehalococcoidia bacterium]